MSDSPPTAPTRPPGLPAALESLTDPVVVVDEAGAITYANRFTFSLLGYLPGELLGRTVAEVVHPDDLERASEVLGRAVREPRHRITPASYRMLRADGDYLDVELNGTRFDPETGDAGPSMLIVGRYSGEHAAQNQTLARLTGGARLAEVLDGIVGYGTWRLPDQHFAVVIAATKGGWLTAGSSLVGDLVQSYPRPDSPWAQASRRGRPMSRRTDDLPGPLREAGRAAGLTVLWAYPVPDPLTNQSAVLVGWANDRSVPSDINFSLESMARTLELVLQWRQHMVELEHAARHDALTGVLNRSGFFDLLEHEASRRADDWLLGVLYVDLDGFKQVNDTHGHGVGDEVLVEVADRLRRTLRPSDVVSRLGGDEFAVVCTELSSPQEAEAIAARVLASFADPFVVEQGLMHVGASIGVAVEPPGPLAAALLMDRADRALYEAKEAGRGTVRVV